MRTNKKYCPLILLRLSFLLSILFSFLQIHSFISQTLLSKVKTHNFSAVFIRLLILIFLFCTPLNIYITQAKLTQENYYPEAQMDNNQELALTQLRTSVEQLGCSTNKYGDKTMMRFLIARSMDPNKAAKMFVQWHKWRESFVPSGFIQDSEIPDELEAKKCYLQGLAKNGLPVVIVKACKHFPSKDQPQFKKFVVHMLDKTIASSFRGREIGDEKMIGILDLEKISYKNVDARGLITGFQFIQAYYPERLAKCFILNMPGFFVSVWKFVSRFLEKATLQKIVIVTNEDAMKEMVEEIGDEILPEEYGGRAKLVALQDVVLTPMENDQVGQINQ